MDFAFTAEQDDLRETVHALFAKRASRERVPFDRPLWNRLAGQVGAVGLAVSPEHGGAGASLVEVGVVLEEAGRALAPVPYLSTVVGAALLGGDPTVASGATIVALALSGPPLAVAGDRLTGVREHVLDGQIADLFVVADGDALYAARAAHRTRLSTLDITRGQARVEFRDAPAVRLDARAGYALDLTRAAIAVESVGVAAASLDRVIAHLRTRRQFGVPLATFQALRHRVADLAAGIEAAASTAWYAFRLAAAGNPELSVAAAAAKLLATEAAYAMTAAAVQLYGGIGFTWEHDAHLYLKRATANRLLFGDPAALRRRIAEQVL